MVAERRGVRVIHGANDGFFDVAGYPVSSVRASLLDAFNISEDAIALANGRRVPNDHQIRWDDVLEFVRERGEKGAGKKKNFTEEDLNKLGFAVVGDEAVPIEDAYPDTSWEPSRLEAYAKGRLARSGKAEEQAILQAHKSAVDLFWAGCAFYFLRDKKKAEGRGVWTTWQRERGYAASTVNDAILLYENAKTPDALTGLGITEAKEKFVRPFKVRDDDGETTPSPPSPKKRPGKTRGSGSGTASGKSPRKPTADADDGDDADVGNSGNAEEAQVIEPTLTLTAELEEIAQRLNEIEQNEMGKVEWKELDQERFGRAGQAINTAIHNIFVRFNNELFSN